MKKFAFALLFLTNSTTLHAGPGPIIEAQFMCLRSIVGFEIEGRRLVRGYDVVGATTLRRSDEPIVTTRPGPGHNVYLTGEKQTYFTTQGNISSDGTSCEPHKEGNLYSELTKVIQSVPEQWTSLTGSVRDKSLVLPKKANLIEGLEHCADTQSPELNAAAKEAIEKIKGVTTTVRRGSDGNINGGQPPTRADFGPAIPLRQFKHEGPGIDAIPLKRIDGENSGVDAVPLRRTEVEDLDAKKKPSASRQSLGPAIPLKRYKTEGSGIQAIPLKRSKPGGSGVDAVPLRRIEPQE